VIHILNVDDDKRLNNQSIVSIGLGLLALICTP